MGKCHVISAKRFGWEKAYDYYTFPIEQYTKEKAIAQFKKIVKKTKKADGNYYSYTAFEIGEKEYYTIIYSGIFDESEFDE